MENVVYEVNKYLQKQPLKRNHLIHAKKRELKHAIQLSDILIFAINAELTELRKDPETNKKEIKRLEKELEDLTGFKEKIKKEEKEKNKT